MTDSRKIIWCLILLSLMILSCSNGVDSLGDENLSINTHQSNVVLTNTSDEILEYLLIEYETTTLIDLNPDAEWPAIESNSTARIPYSNILGYQASSTEVLIMWRKADRSYQNSLKFKL